MPKVQSSFSIKSLGLLLLFLTLVSCVRLKPQTTTPRYLPRPTTSQVASQPASLPQDEVVTQPKVTTLDDLAKRSTIPIEAVNITSPVKTTYGDITAEAATGEQIKFYAPLLIEEFGRYPVALLQKINLKQVVLCRRLAYDGQYRNGVPDFEHDTLYLEVERGNHDPEYLRKTIHHEIFHIIDWKDDGLVYSDDDWLKLNPASFKYGNGGKNAQGDPTGSLLTDAIPGFLTKYSTSGVEEDKAEIYANMMVSYSYVEARLQKDVYLLAKVRQMRTLLIQFCPEIKEMLVTREAPNV